MANTKTLVDSVIGLSPPTVTLATRTGQPSSQQITVSFQNGQSGLLDMTRPQSAVWAEVLESLRQASQPAYVQLDPVTNVITELLCPLTVSVGDITPTAAKDGVEVELHISHARHYLRRTNPEYQQLLNTLRAASKQGVMAIVTETPDQHEIIDVRLLSHPPFAAETLAPPESPEAIGAPIPPQQAQQLFNLVNAKLCCPASAPAPCIPFLYPDDGCWGRAHEMCRLMIGAGAQPEKVWIYGNLRVATHNNPACQVYWGWHVAPTLLVNTSAGPQVQVIDPSLFPGPVSQATWASVQGDPNPTLVATSAAVFHRTVGGSVTYDNTYARTNDVLNTYRNQLKLRCASSAGPPPYLQCLTKPPGVQWFGTIGPNATGRWFTWGWPAAWHVFWTIMPITPCPGAPQLSWKVQTERANATQSTYWITVKNLTSDPVRFEGRYDILSR